MTPEPARPIPDPGFPGDTGAVDPELAEALAAYDADPDRRHLPTLAVLQRTRLLVPVVAVAGEVGKDASGRAHEKSADMAAVLMRGLDGRLALLAFTGLAALRAWNPDARPVPVPAAQAARAAVQEQAAAMVVDIAGPTRFVVAERELRSLADGETLAPVGDGYGWVRPSG